MKTKATLLLRSIITSLLFLISINLHAITVTWVGGNGHWHQPLKWDTGQIPTANDDVVIPSGFARVDFPNAQARTLTVESGAIFLVTTNGELLFENHNNIVPITNNGLMGQFGLIRLENNSFPVGALGGIYNTGDYYVLQGGTLELSDNDGANIHNHFNANFNNYGTILCETSTNSGNQGIINSGDFENRQAGVIYIEGTEEGIYINSGQYTRFRNRGKIVVSNADFKGIKNNSGPSYITLRNYATGSITLKGCQISMGNSINWGVITVTNFNSPYNFAAMNSGENTRNDGLINLHDNKNGIWINQFGNFENNGSINIYRCLQNSIFSNSSSSPIINNPEGFIYLEEPMSNGSITNDGIMISKSSMPHTSNIVNNGIIEDYHGALPSSTINNKVIISPIAGPLIDGIPMPNYLDKVSLSGITIGSWRDEIFAGDIAGTYNASSNVFTSNNHGEGEGDLYASFSIAGTSNSALINIKILTSWNLVNQEDRKEEIQFRNGGNAELEILCFPNPTRDQIKIQWNDSEIHPTMIKIMDAHGRIVCHQIISEIANEVNVNLEGSAGMYFYHLISGDKTIKTGRIVKID